MKIERDALLKLRQRLPSNYRKEVQAILLADTGKTIALASISQVLTGIYWSEPVFRAAVKYAEQCEQRSKELNMLASGRRKSNKRRATSCNAN